MSDINKSLPEPELTFSQKLTAFFKRNLLVFILIIVVLVVYFWFSMKRNSDQAAFEQEKTQIVNQYEFQLDSIQVKTIEFGATLFSWSVRSEMLRSNMENLNQLVNVYVKESGANLVQIINPDDQTIFISTDKKFEGEKFVAPTGVSWETPTTRTDSSSIYVYTPIIGFNKKIGLLVVETVKR